MHPGGTVPPFKMHPGGTVPPFKMQPGGTIPPFKMHPGGTLNFYVKFFVWVLGIVSCGKVGVLGQSITIKCLLVKEDNLVLSILGVKGKIIYLPLTFIRNKIYRGKWRLC